MQANTTDNPVIENLHESMRKQFQAMHTAYRPSLREIQQKERQAVIAQIKDILFARLLVRMIKNHSLIGNREPLVIDLQALLEAL